ncbi:hypothetical protein Tco_1306216 [Tanacetum coccineum]
MLDRTDFESRKQRIRLYCRGKENRVNILKSIDEGPFQLGTFRATLAEGNEGAMHLGPELPRVYTNLSPEEKDRYNTDIRATNILLQGLPKDIYTLISHYTDAKDIWDNAKMLLEGSELTKEDRESQLYDDFEHFHQNKGETIHDYYGRFVTAVKLNRGLRDSNYDQLYAYLKQHEAHANKNKMMLDRFTQHTVDPLALMSNVSHQQYYSQSSTTPPSTHVDRIEDRGTMHGVQVQLVIGEHRTELGILIQVKQGRQACADDKLRRIGGRLGCVALDEEQLLFIAGGQDNAIDEDVDEQPVQDLALNVDNVFQADDYDAFDFDVDEAPTTQTMFMANLSSADLDVVCEHHEEHEMHDDVQPNYVVDSHANYTSDSNMIPYDQYVKDNAVPVVQSNVSSVPNDAYMMIFNDMHEPHAQSVSDTTRNYSS